MGATATTTLTLEGVTGSNDIDFKTLSDVSVSFLGEYNVTSYRDGRQILDADLSILNDGQYLIDAPLLVGIDHISEPSVRVQAPDGTTPDGIPYFDYTDLIDDGTLSPDELTDRLRVSFDNPQELPFTYDLVLLGQLNRPPAFVTVPAVQAIVGQAYLYDFLAVDPDENDVNYTLISGPAGATFDSAAGTLSWTPQAGDEGNYQVRLQADDGRGGSTEQRYVLTVLDPPPNRPPFFTSLPELAANVNVEYAYTPAATDPDGDTVSYSVISGPAGFQYDPPSGEFLWTPTADDLGPNTVTVQAADPSGEIDQQTFTISVAPNRATPIL